MDAESRLPVPVCVASYPRSGNTLFRMAVHSAFGEPTYSVYDDADLARVAAVGQLPWRGSAGFVKTHELPDGHVLAQAPVVHVVRHPCDTFVSYLHYIRAHSAEPAQADWFEQAWAALEGPCLHGHPRFATWRCWQEHYLACGRVVLRVTYSDLCARLSDVMDQVHQQFPTLVRRESWTVPPLADLHEQAPTEFRAGVDGAWRQVLTPAQVDQLWSVCGPVATKLGFTI